MELSSVLENDTRSSVFTNGTFNILTFKYPLNRNIVTRENHEIFRHPQVYKIRDNSVNVNLYNNGINEFYEYGRYAISPIDRRDKFTDGLYDCFMFVFTGVAKEDRSNISFMVHAWLPGMISRHSESLKEFKNYLSIQMMKLKELSSVNSVKCVIKSGKYQNISKDAEYCDYIKTRVLKANQDFKESVKFSNEMIFKHLGFIPAYLRPNNTAYQVDATYQTQKQKLILEIPEIQEDYENIFLNRHEVIETLRLLRVV